LKRLSILISAIVSLVLLLAPAVYAQDIKHSELVPTDRVFVIEEGKKVAEYTREVSVPEGSLVSCQGRCLAKMDDIAMVAEDKSRFRIDSETNSRTISVEEGSVFFGLTHMPRPVVFMTPQGAVMANHVLLDASAGGGMLEGYVRTGGDGSEIGVLQGGRLSLLTAEGEKVLQPGQRFVLAQAGTGDSDDAPAAVAARPRTSHGLSRGSIIAIGAGAAAVAGIVLLAADFSSSSDLESSPSNPTN
jgi:hypothetical protein